jgi:hypothetical protein
MTRINKEGGRPAGDTFKACNEGRTGTRASRTWGGADAGYNSTDSDSCPASDPIRPRSTG